MNDHRYQLHFLSPNATLSALGGNTSTNRRSLEAARAEARSHAARVSHPSIKGPKPFVRKVRIPTFARSEDGSASASPASERQSNATSPASASRKFDLELENADRRPPRTTLPILKFRLHIENGKNKRPSALQLPRKEDEEDLEGARRRERAMSVPVAISKSALDPFVRPALELSVPDQHLLHLYLTTVPDQIYGSTTGAVSAVAQHGTVGVVATNEIVVMWLLLVIESQIVSYQPTEKDRQLSILTRRSLVYRLMNTRLTDQESSLMDDYVLAVAIAGGCEHRMGDTKGAQYHVKAARKLLELRGGMKSVRDITYPLGLMVVNVFVENGVEGLWKTHGELQTKLTGLSQWIRDLQTWNFNIRSGSTGTRRQSHHDYTESHRDFGVDHNSSHNEHLSRRAHAFAPTTALFHYVNLPEGEMDRAQCRFYLGVLFAINTAFYAFRDNGTTTDTYLKGLTTAVEMSAPSNLALRAGGAKLPSLLLILMIAHNAAEAGDRNEATEKVFHVEEVFEFVEMIMMTSQGSQMNVLKALSSWLTTAITNTRNMAFMSNSKLDILAGEVEHRWFSDQLEPMSSLEVERSV